MIATKPASSPSVAQRFKDGPVTLLIVPALTEIAGQCRIVAFPGHNTNALKDYRANPGQWHEVGLMNSHGKLVHLDAGKNVWDDIQGCEPLMAGLVFHYERLHPEPANTQASSKAAAHNMPPVKILKVLIRGEDEFADEFHRRAIRAQPSPYLLEGSHTVTGACLLTEQGLISDARFSELSRMCVIACYTQAHADRNHMPFEPAELMSAIKDCIGDAPLEQAVPQAEREVVSRFPIETPRRTPKLR